MIVRMSISLRTTTYIATNLQPVRPGEALFQRTPEGDAVTDY
jgi:hypothetical protein